MEDTLEGSLLPDGQLQFGETISIPQDSYLLKNMRPLSELPLGYQKMMTFPPEWLATISHLSAGEQEKAKTDWANQMDAMIEASVTPEAREAQRLEMMEVGKVQQRFLAKMAAKKAAKDTGSK
jgi:predicted secreted protein